MTADSIDNDFNSGNIEVGTVGVFRRTSEGEDWWSGHTVTITDVQRDENGNVTSITTIEGHGGGNHDINTYTSMEQFQAETVGSNGEFVGWGEFEP